MMKTSYTICKIKNVSLGNFLKKHAQYSLICAVINWTYVNFFLPISMQNKLNPTTKCLVEKIVLSFFFISTFNLFKRHHANHLSWLYSSHFILLLNWDEKTKKPKKERVCCQNVWRFLYGNYQGNFSFFFYFSHITQSKLKKKTTNNNWTNICD